MFKLLVIVLAVLSVTVDANAKGGGAVVSPAAGGYNIRFSKNGTPLAVTPGGAPGQNVGTAAGVIPLPNNNVANIIATGAITAAAAAGGWVAAIAAIGGVALAAIPVIQDWMHRAQVSTLPDGTPGGQPEGLCTANCYVYYGRGSFGAGQQEVANSGAALAALYCADGTAANAGNASYRGLTCTFDGSRVLETFFYGDGGASFSRLTAVYSAPRPPDPVTADVPLSMAVAQKRMADASPTAAEVQALVDANFPPVVDSVSLTGPASVFVGNTVKMNSDGSSETIEETAKFTYINKDYVAVDLQKMFSKSTPGKTDSKVEVVTTQNPDGTISTSTVTRTITTPATTTVATETSPKPALTSCGMPGGPACVIDETGTPDGNGALDKSPFDAQMQKQIDAIPSIVSPDGKNTSWGVMPNWVEGGACVPWHFYDLPPVLGSRSVDINLCPIKPYADGASNLIWVALGFFGITSMVFTAMTSKAS